MPQVQLRVLHNGDDVFLIWRSAKPISGCRGFAVYRERNGAVEIAQSWAGFKNEKWEKGEHRPSTVWPIQKYMWSDYAPKMGDSVRYRIVPVVRKNGKLQEAADMASEWSDKLKVDPQVSKRFACYFNRGIVATQWVQRLLGPEEKVQARRAKLDDVITDYDNPHARNLLGGQLRDKMMSLLEEAKDKKQKVWAALFELTDKELWTALGDIGANAIVVLADGAVAKSTKSDDNDAGADPGVKSTGRKDDENYEARQALKNAGVKVYNRMTKGKFLAHNKILVIGDNKDPRWVWTGSTNWTPSGLCTQANNGILIDDPALAAKYRDQIELLAKDKGLSPPALAESNSTPVNENVGQTPVTVWFTRTNKLVDLQDAIARIKAAKNGALFLMFQTGMKNSLLGAIMDRRTDDDFYVHGVISTMPQVSGQKKGSKKSKQKPTHDDTIAKQVAFVHRNERIKYAPDLLVPFAVEGETEHWFDEFVKKNGAHAIVHSKIVVLDPFGDKPIVITGSHNMGTTASSKNDENLVIVEGDGNLAAAYAVNVMGIYNNYRWRYRLAEGSKWDGLDDGDSWQKSYFNDPAKVAEAKFWES